jgi:hypothetical protein
MSADTATLIAARDGFELYRRPDRSDGDWQNLKLVLTKRKAAKHNWHLGWHGQQKRLARNRDSLLLREHYPATHDWVLDQLRQRSEVGPVEHAADIDAAADASAASADTAVPADTSAVDTRAEALARAVEDGKRWHEAQEAKRREAEAQRQRERQECVGWQRAQYGSYLAQFGAFGFGPPWGQI